MAQVQPAEGQAGHQRDNPHQRRIGPCHQDPIEDPQRISGEQDRGSAEPLAAQDQQAHPKHGCGKHEDAGEPGENRGAQAGERYPHEEQHPVDRQDDTDPVVDGLQGQAEPEQQKRPPHQGGPLLAPRAMLGRMRQHSEPDPGQEHEEQGGPAKGKHEDAFEQVVRLLRPDVHGDHPDDGQRPGNIQGGGPFRRGGRG